MLNVLSNPGIYGSLGPAPFGFGPSIPCLTVDRWFRDHWTGTFWFTDRMTFSIAMSNENRPLYL